ITKDNIIFCKDSILKVAEIRHLEGIKGNFGVSDTEYISTSDRVSVPEIGGSEIEQKTDAVASKQASKV
ncbi:MAG: hypothetical protein WAM42_02385, partial [Candidatus Nitrosopolaris sp.]